MKALGLVLVLCVATVSLGTAQYAVSKPEQEERFAALATIDFGDIYSDDGAADGTITYKGEILKSVGPNLRPDARVKAVVDLRKAAIPLLIEHLDDTRPTRTLFKGRPTPLGHLALDILTHMIKPTKEALVVNCAQDGLGACIQNGYYFRPDALAQEMTNVKNNWQSLYLRGLVLFNYPRWWK